VRLSPFRRQMPSWSPVSVGSLLSGLGAEFGMGSPLTVLSELLRDEFCATQVILTDCGTSALTLAIRIALDTMGRESIALPAYCCYDLATAAVGADADVVFYDLDPTTLGPEPRSLELALRSRPAAVVGASLFAIPFDSDAIRSASDKAGSLYIEDAAQGSGGEWRGRSLGSLGDLSVLSFGRGKGRTGGGGGALLVRDGRVSQSTPEHPMLVREAGRGLEVLLRLIGQWALGRPSLFSLPASLPLLGLGETTYREPSIIAGMAEGPCAALLANWEQSRDEAVMRRSSGERLWQIVEGNLNADTIIPPAGAAAGWLRFPVVLSRSPTEEAAMAASRMGAARAYPMPLPNLPALCGRIIGPVSASGATLLAERLWTVPTHSRTSVDEAVSALRELCTG